MKALQKEIRVLQQRLTDTRWFFGFIIVGIVVLCIGIIGGIVFHYHTPYIEVSTELNMLRVSYNKCEDQKNIKDDKCKEEAKQLHDYWYNQVQNKEKDHKKDLIDLNQKLHQEFKKEQQNLLEQWRNISKLCDNDKQELEKQVTKFEEKLKYAITKTQDADKVIKESKKREDVLIFNVTEIRIALERCKNNLHTIGEKYVDCQQQLKSKWF